MDFLAIMWVMWTIWVSDQVRFNFTGLLLGFSRMIRDYLVYVKKMFIRGERQSVMFSLFLCMVFFLSEAMKVNSDAAVLSNNLVGIGCVIYNCTGSVIRVVIQRLEV